MSRRFVRLGKTHVPSAIKCIAETFAAQSRSDPFTALFGFKESQWASMVSSFIHRAGSSTSPLSIVAINSIGEIDGVMLNEDWTTPTPHEYNALGPEWHSTRAIFREVHSQYNDKHPSDPHQFMHTLYFTCVRPSLRGQGVMKGLWHQTVDVAQEEGFSHIIAEAGSEDVRQVLAENLGFREVAAVPYSTFTFNDTEFNNLTKLDPVQFTRLSLMKRTVPSNLY